MFQRISVSLLLCAVAAVNANALDARLGAIAASPAKGVSGLPWVMPAVVVPQVQYRVFASASVGENVSYHVFLPDAYAAQPTRRFPVLYWLHGSGGGAEGIAPVSARFDQAMAQGLIPQMIIVYPNGLPYGMWCDAASGLQPVESMLVLDLIPEVERQFRALPNARGRLLEGFSMGGYGAGRIGLKFNTRFAGFSMLGAGPLQLDFLQEGPNFLPIELRRRILNEVYGGNPAIFEAQSPWRLAETFGNLLPPGLPVRQVIGTLDFTLQPNRDFHQRLEQIALPHVYVEAIGVDHSVIAIMNSMGASFWAFHRLALAPLAEVVFSDGFEALP